MKTIVSCRVMLQLRPVTSLDDAKSVDDGGGGGGEIAIAKLKAITHRLCRSPLTGTQLNEPAPLRYACDKARAYLNQWKAEKWVHNNLFI